MAGTPMDLSEAAAGGMYRTRTDLQQCRIVDTAIHLQGNSNTMAAVEYLRMRGIDTQLIARVLLEPGRRRRPDNVAGGT